MQSIVKRSLQVGNRTMQQKIIEPIQEIVASKVKVEPIHLQVQYEQAEMEHIRITSNVACNLDAYSYPIDMEPCYNKPLKRTLLIEDEAKRLKMKVRKNQYKKTSNCASSDLRLVDWRNDNFNDEANVYSHKFSSRQPQEVCNDLKTDSIIHSSQNITYSRAKIASQKMKQVFQHSRLLRQIKEGSLQKHSTYDKSTMLKNLDLVENSCRVAKKSCLEKNKLDDFQQKTHNSNDNQIIHQRTNLEAFHEQKDEKMKCKKKSSSLVNPKVLKYKNNDWTSSKTKVSCNHGSSKLKLHLANQGECKDCGNTSYNFEPIGKSQATIQSNNMVSNNNKIVQINLKDFNTDTSTLLEKNASNYNMALLKENTTIGISEKIKIGTSSNQKVKDQILSTLNLNKRTNHKSSQNMARCLDEDKKKLDPESLHSNILCERKLETLNIIDYKSLEIDGGTMSEINDPYRFEVYDICDEKRVGCNASISFNVATTLENSQIKMKPMKTKVGKENRGQIEIKCVPSNLKESEDIKNKKLSTPSSNIEDKNLQVSNYDPNQHGENVYKPKSFVKNNSIDKIQVHIKAQEPFKEFHLQNIELLKLLQDLQFQRQISKICNKKIEGMTDPTLQCGYLAQYIKTKKMGLQKNNYLPTLSK